MFVLQPIALHILAPFDEDVLKYYRFSFFFVTSLFVRHPISVIYQRFSLLLLSEKKRTEDRSI